MAHRPHAHVRLPHPRELQLSLHRAQRSASSGGAGTSRCRTGFATTCTSRWAATSAATARAYANLVIVFLLCGLWHGASWPFVLWGAWHGRFSWPSAPASIPRCAAADMLRVSFPTSTRLALSWAAGCSSVAIRWRTPSTISRRWRASDRRAPRSTRVAQYLDAARRDVHAGASAIAVRARRSLRRIGAWRDRVAQTPGVAAICVLGADVAWLVARRRHGQRILSVGHLQSVHLLPLLMAASPTPCRRRRCHLGCHLQLPSPAPATFPARPRRGGAVRALALAVPLLALHVHLVANHDAVREAGDGAVATHSR